MDSRGGTSALGEKHSVLSTPRSELRVAPTNRNIHEVDTTAHVYRAHNVGHRDRNCRWDGESRRRSRVWVGMTVIVTAPARRVSTHRAWSSTSTSVICGATLWTPVSLVDVTVKGTVRNTRRSPVVNLTDQCHVRNSCVCADCATVTHTTVNQETLGTERTAVTTGLDNTRHQNVWEVVCWGGE